MHVEAWEVRQTAVGYPWTSGKMKVSIAKEAFRMEDSGYRPPQKFVLLTSAPKWEVASFSEQCKDKMPMELWLKILKGRTASRYSTGAVWKQTGQTIVAGVPAIEFETELDGTVNGAARARLCVARDINLSAPASKVWSVLSGSPDKGKMPLRFLIETVEGKVIRQIETTSVRRVTLTGSNFELPPMRWAKALSAPFLADKDTAANSL